MNNLTLIISLLFFCLFNLRLNAQEEAPIVSKYEQKEIIDSINSNLKRAYIFEDVANKMISYLNSNLEVGRYDSIVEPTSFADKLTEDLQFISHDKHLNIFFSENKTNEKITAEDSLKEQINYQEFRKAMNNDFTKLEILQGNIGYLNLRGFAEVDALAEETVTYAMGFLSNTKAIIIDLRDNHGGSPTMIRLLATYFFSSEKDTVHLNDFYLRMNNDTSQSWTLPHVLGKRMSDVDLYILTSKNTFSAAEEFAYDLQNLKRAIIIGDTTGGGAHPGGRMDLTKGFSIWLPTGRAINPISKTNWEGIGVLPDIPVKADVAHTMAKITALEKMKITCTNDLMKNEITFGIFVAKNELRTPIQLTKKELKRYVGVYSDVTVKIEETKLFIETSDEKHELIPIGNNVFKVKDIQDANVKFTLKKDKANSITFSYFDGGEFEINKSTAH